MENLKNKHKGQKVFIVGTGKSIQYLSKEDIGDGIVITLNSAIYKVEQLDFQNVIYAMAKDGGNKRVAYDFDRQNPECNFRGKCSFEFCGLPKPKTSILLVNENESKYCYEDYSPRYIFDLKKLGMNHNEFSLATAIKLAEYMGCTSYCLVSCDAHSRGETENSVGYAKQVEKLKPYLEKIDFTFLSPGPEPVKVNLGCGNRKIEGYDNLDIQERVNPDVVCDVLEGLPYDDNSVDEVRAWDFLEHIPLGKTIGVIEEIFRVLKPGGKFESFTPDAEYGQGAFQDPTHISFWTENSWLYFSDEGYRDLYGIKANFKIRMQRINTDQAQRVSHMHVIAEKTNGRLLNAIK